jgi:hypothetical protein
MAGAAPQRRARLLNTRDGSNKGSPASSPRVTAAPGNRFIFVININILIQFFI